jgi:ribosomal protein S12 methylthiotransferase accessory factor
MTQRIPRRRSPSVKAASAGRPKRVARRKSAVVVIRGFDSSDPVPALVRRALGGKVRVTHQVPRPPESAVAAVLLERLPSSGTPNPGALDQLVPVGCPAIHIGRLHHEILVGPLMVPDRAGCGWCAHERRRAVVEGVEGTSCGIDGASVMGRLPLAVGRWVVKEIRAILRGGWRRSRLLDHAWLFRDTPETPARHRVIPLAWCPRCGGAAAHGTGCSDIESIDSSTALPKEPGPDFDPEQPPEELLQRLAGWVDPTLGIVSRIYVEDPAERGMRLPIVATAAPPFVVEPNGALRRLPLGWGKGLTISGAILSAVGEAIERYAPSLPDPARLVWRRLGDLEGEVLDPRKGPLYSERQYRTSGFPFARFDPEVTHPWVEGQWLGTRHRVWVPAVFAYLSLELAAAQHFCQGTSNGLAAATSAEEGQLRATLELVERDAFMTAWLTGSPCPRLDRELGLESDLREILDGIRQMGGEVEVRVLPTAKCGTAIACLARGDGQRYPGMTLGLGADLDPASALRQAILELGQTGPHLRRLMQCGVVKIPDSESEVREMLDHAAYYFRQDRVGAFEAIRSSSRKVCLGELQSNGAPRSLQHCAAALSDAGVRVAVVNVTSPDVAGGPFQVWRAVSAELQPISYGFGMDRQGVRGIGSRPRRGARRGVIHPIW